MLKYLLAGKVLLLDKDNSIKLTWRNPACNVTSFKGNTGLGITIPINDTNRMLLGNPERYEQDDTDFSKKFPGFSVEYKGVALLSGNLVIQNANENDGKYEGWLQDPIGIIGSEYRKKYITDCPVFNILKNVLKTTQADPDSDEYCLPPVKNKDFFKDFGKKITLTRYIPDPENPGEYKEEEYETSILAHRFEKSASNIVNFRSSMDPGNVKTTHSSANIIANYNDLEVYVVSPMLYVSYVLKAILENSGYHIRSNYIANDISLKNLCIYNNYDITMMSYGASTGWITHNWYDEETQRATGKRFDTILRWNDTPLFTYSKLLPQIELRKFILGVQNFTNCCIRWNRDNSVDIIDRESILTGNSIDIDQFLIGKWNIGERKNVTLKFTYDQDTDDTIFAERWVDLDDRRDDIRDPVEYWSDLENLIAPEFGDIRFVRTRKIFAEYKWITKVEEDPNTGDEITTDLLGWEHVSVGYQNGFYNYGQDEEEEIPTNLGPCLYNYGYEVEQKGNQGSNKLAFNNFTFRIISQTGEFLKNFEWEDETNGILKTRYKNWARFWSTRVPVVRRSNLPLNALTYIIDNITSKFRSEEGEFIIETLETEFGIDRIGESTLTGFKV